MPYLLKLNLIGRGGKAKWVTELIEAAENHQPVAYIVAVICLCIVSVGLVYYFIECNRLRNGSTNLRSFAQLTWQLLFGLAIPGLLLYWLAIKLIG